ncbi:hypothetical protein SLG_39100 [Sphingobium sp. SYK-6]|nr:hypothetical protein SLG_39100 [Sphingobium sp. SYK-6]
MHFESPEIGVWSQMEGFFAGFAIRRRGERAGRDPERNSSELGAGPPQVKRPETGRNPAQILCLSP